MTDISNSPWGEFAEQVKKANDIKELYTELTGEEFVDIRGRQRARCRWRQDNTPSLTHYSDNNLLTDFAEQGAEGSTKAGRSYNPIHIMLFVGGASHFAHAVSLLAKRAGIEVPKELKSKKDEDKHPGQLGDAINKIWEECKLSVKDFFDVPARRKPEFSKFLEDRNIPLDPLFWDVLNIGICPDYDKIEDILTQLKIKVKDEDKMFINKSMPYNSIVFPLYNRYGALTGLRFRYINSSGVKDFKQWVPITNSCYYNMQRFRYRPQDKRINFVEGEMNLIAYGIAAYRFYNEAGDNKKKLIDETLRLIYATGSKTTDLSVLENEIPKALYFPDYDVSDEVVNPKQHPIIDLCSRISRQIHALDFEVIDWSCLPEVTQKFDLEDFLKSHNYDMGKVGSLTRVSLPRYCINIINAVCDKILNPENKRIAQISMANAIADKLLLEQKIVFGELVEKEFKVTKEIAKNISDASREAKYGAYRIYNGQITKQHTKDTQVLQIPQTNFFTRMVEEISFFNELNNVTDKKYKIEIVCGNDVRSTVVDPADITNLDRFKTVLNTAHSFSELQIIDPDFEKYGSDITSYEKHKYPFSYLHIFFSRQT